MIFLLICVWVSTHQFVLWRWRTGVEIVYLVSPAENRSIISFHWNLQGRIYSQADPFLAENRFEPWCQFEQQTQTAELIHSCVLMFLTRLSSWGLHCSKTRLHPKLLPRGGTRWSPLHHAKSSSQVCHTGQSSIHSPVHTQTGVGGGTEGQKAQRFKQNAFYFTVK